MSTKGKMKTSKNLYQDDSSSSSLANDEESTFYNGSLNNADTNPVTRVYNNGQSVLNEMISDVMDMCTFFSPPLENLHNDYDFDNKSYNSSESDSPKSLKDYEILLKEEANRKQKLEKERRSFRQKQRMISDLNSKLSPPSQISKMETPQTDELIILGLSSFDSTAKLETVTEDLEEDNLSSVMSSNSVDDIDENDGMSFPQYKQEKYVEILSDNLANNLDEINCSSKPHKCETTSPTLGPIDIIVQLETSNEQSKDIAKHEAYPCSESRNNPITNSQSHSIINQHIIPSEVAYQKDNKSIYSQLSASFDDKSDYVFKKYDKKVDTEDENNSETESKNSPNRARANKQNKLNSTDNFNDHDFEMAIRQTTKTAMPIYDDESASLEFSARPLFHYLDKYDDRRKKRILLIILGLIALMITIIVSVKYSNSSGSNIPDQTLEEGNVKSDITVESTPDVSIEVLTGNITELSSPSLRPVESPSNQMTQAPYSSPHTSITLNPTSISQQITDLISSISGLTVSDPLSFQYKALNWLIQDQENHQKEQIENENKDGNMALVMKSFRVIQRYILMLLYFSLSGENWIRKDGFESSLDECTWFGITCSDSRVIEIDLGKNNLSGSLVSEIGELNVLERLTLRSNNLVSSMPESVWERLPNLKYINLRSNNLIGSIPKSLGGLSLLEELHLHTNEFNGSIPKEIFDLNNLVAISLQSNKLSSTLPKSFTGMKNLEYLSFSENNLSGPLPTSLSSLEKLKYMHFDHNQLQDSLPDVFGSLPSLENLSIRDNLLTGTIPRSIGNCDNLQALELDQNNLSGSIPDELCNLSNLEVMRLDTNEFSGSIPICLNKLNSLYMLQVASNSLTGVIPEDIGSLSNLEYLMLNDNLLSGRIPSSIGNLQFLELLNLSTNALTGRIPPPLGNLQQLVRLHLQQNNLRGTIPLSLQNLNELESLLLYGNNFRGEVSDEICALSIEKFELDCEGFDSRIVCQCCSKCW